MNETTKSILFVVCAACAAGLGYWTWVDSQPRNVAGAELVGQPFYADFSGVDQITALELSARDDKNRFENFSVRKTGGLWTIPTHNDYPAEAADRLATTSTALIGLERNTLVGRLESDFAKYGVLDPKDDEIDDPENTGKRITLLGEGGTVLADFIVGKKYEDEQRVLNPPTPGAPRTETFYVRRADEKQTYLVPMSLNISTRFSDWIDTKLLPVEANELKEIVVDNFDLVPDTRDPLGLTMVAKQGEKIELAKSDQFGPWQMTGLDITRETLNAMEVNSLAQTLANLKIVGVRPKFRFNNQSLIGPDMKLVRLPELEANPAEFQRVLTEMQQDLQEKGFFLSASEQDPSIVEIVSEFGELSFTTEDGIVFTLDLGKAIDGDREFLEIGTISKTKAVADTAVESSDDQTEAVDPVAAEHSDTQEQTDSAVANAEDDDVALNDAKNRYVLVRIALDPSKVGGGLPQRPVEPVPPVKPEGYMPAAEPPPAEAPGNKDGQEKQEEDEPPTVAGDEAETKPESDDANASDSTEQKMEPDQEAEQVGERDPRFVEYETALQQYEQDKTQYEIDLSRYEKQVQAHEEEVKESQKKVDMLNARFGAWYYVVSATNLGQLRVDRAQLVSPVDPPENDPGIIIPDLNGDPPPALDRGVEGEMEESSGAADEASKVEATDEPKVEGDGDSKSAESKTPGTDAAPHDESSGSQDVDDDDKSDGEPAELPADSKDRSGSTAEQGDGA